MLADLKKLTEYTKLHDFFKFDVNIQWIPVNGASGY